MRLHLVALPHTQISQAFCGCAYTAKALKFCKMVRAGLASVFLYAPEGPPVPGATLVPCLTNDERLATFGGDDPNRLPSWPRDEQSQLFNQRAIEALRERVEPHDLILLTAGWTHKAIADAFPSHICCEPGVGYEGILTNHCAFESYAWMHHVYAQKGINDGRWFDTVIPNYFDPDDFPFLNNGYGIYLLFVGRLVSRKGPHIASEIANACGIPLVVAGAGGKEVGDDIVAPDVTVKNARYVGPVGVKDRAELLAGACALIVPTTYIEPFGGVAVEAMMCGTPVIAPDWGAFTETVSEGVSGFRFRTLSEAIAAVEKCASVDRRNVRGYALQNYSLNSVRPKFDAWFARLASLWDDGWYFRH
jgi:glycosyltransferase involved in cell wall biosynthesis